jgi:hypothetical protein
LKSETEYISSNGFVEIYMPKLGELRPNYQKIEKVHEVIEARKQQPL